MDLCMVCRQTFQWHVENKPLHEFVREGEAPNIRERQTPTPPVMKGGDPILRLALIKAGVITEANLAVTETWIRQAADQGMMVAVVDGEFKLFSIEEWISRLTVGS